MMKKPSDMNVGSETINMLLTFFLGFILWWIFSWLKRRFISPEQLLQDDDIWSKLPSGNMTDTQKRQTYAEARKKYLDEQKKTNSISFYEEALVHNKVNENLGYYHTGANEGALALAESRKQRFEAMKKLGVEKKTRMEELSKNQENKSSDTKKND